MNSIPVLVEAKKEYTNQLQQILSPRLYEGFKSIYNDILKAISDEIIENNNQHSSVVKVFQKSLKDIPLWNNEMIKNEYGRIEKISNCDYFENLIEAVFITNTKILTSVQINNNNSLSIKINVPQPQHFIHKCYIECSKEIYKNPYIFDMSRNLTPKEKHSNLRDSLSIINHSISNAIRDLLPIRDILKQGLLNETNKTNEDNELSFQENPNIKNMTENNEDEDENYNDQEDEENISIDDEEDLDNEKNEDQIEEYNNQEEGIFSESNNLEENKIEENINIENEQENIEQAKLIDDNIVNIEENMNNEIKNVIIDSSNEKSEEEINKFNNDLIGGDYNSNDDLKEINLSSNPIIKKIENVEKIEKIENAKEPEVRREIEDLIRPIQNNNSNLININSDIRKIKQKNFIKKKLLGSKINNSFYQKKYDENLANYNYTSESYLDDSDNKDMTKNNINLNYGSSDEEDNNPIELV